jgi:hypothetical protein
MCMNGRWHLRYVFALNFCVKTAKAATAQRDEKGVVTQLC